ncbi:MAG: lysophospholipid acyltransferase family protein [Bacilli bacterium]|nr:lysophospholipid acyltransferase family protein [Bacilli bacterium]
MKEPLLYKIVRPIILTWFYPSFRPIYINKENIPKKGRVILAGTHVSKLDGFLLGSSTRRSVRFIAKDELFKGIGKWFFKSCGFVPVNRRVKDKTVIPEALKLLNNESLIGIFPEGTVNRTNDVIMPFKKGAVKMAIESKSPIIPFAIVGKYTKFKRNIKIIFGELYYPKSKEIEKETKILEKKVKNIIKESRENL